MENLLDVANLFIQTIDYQIKVDLNKGDEEGATLKEMTKQRVQAVIDKHAPLPIPNSPRTLSLRALKLLDRLRAGEFYPTFHPATPKAMQELIDAELVGTCGRPEVLRSCYVPRHGYVPYVEERFFKKAEDTRP